MKLNDPSGVEKVFSAGAAGVCGVCEACGVRVGAGVGLGSVMTDEAVADGDGSGVALEATSSIVPLQALRKNAMSARKIVPRNILFSMPLNLVGCGGKGADFLLVVTDS